MKKTINRHWKTKKVFGLLMLLFVLTFSLRWAYEIYFSYNDVTINYYAGSDNYSNYESESQKRVLSNIATDKINQKDFTGQVITIDQKYEKTANICSDTIDFKNDNQELRQIIKEHGAVIQMESLRGLEGNQSLTLTIGVVPEYFDAIVESIKTIGTLKSFTVDKVDKTSEYRSLIAEQETLKKTRNSYTAIKEKGGSTQDLLLLEEKILEVEEKLQALGVDIGLYSSEYSFCTVNFTLNEVAKQVISVRFVFTCAKNSFFWTVIVFALIMFLILAALATTAVTIGLYNYIKKTIAKNDAGNTQDTVDEGKRID